MMQDTVRSSTACQPIAMEAPFESTEHPVRPVAGLNWRHAATVVLLLVALPVLLGAAVLTLPLLLFFLFADGLRKLFELDSPLGRATSH